jgi:hypothetical protein
LPALGQDPCLIHLVRASLRFASKRDHPKLVPALKAIYPVPTEQVTEETLDAFAASDVDLRYPAIVRICSIGDGQPGAGPRRVDASRAACEVGSLLVDRCAIDEGRAIPYAHFCSG